MKKRKMLSMILAVALVMSFFTVLPMDTVSAQDTGEIWPTDEDGGLKEHFLQSDNLYFTVAFDPPEVVTATVRLRDSDGIPVDSRTVTTDADGLYRSSDFNVFFDLSTRPIGDYTLRISDPVVDHEPAEIEIYEADYTLNSEIFTTADDYETPRNYFFEGDMIFYHVALIDQHGYPAPGGAGGEWIRVTLQQVGEDENELYNGWLEDDGTLNEEFSIWEGRGDYRLRVYDFFDDDVLYDSHTFTVISMEISIQPDDVDVYTQGQNIEIRIDSNFPDDFNVSIANSTVEPYEILEGAEWTEQSFENEFWNAHYLIPDNVEDGTYFVVIRKADDGEIVGFFMFEIRKFTLHVTTNKQVYLPGEIVRAYYIVENNLDGSPAQGVTVEWRATYIDTDNDPQELSGSSTEGRFSFELPDDARTNMMFSLEVWANHTAGFNDFSWLYSHVGNLRTNVNTDSFEYLPGQMIYVYVRTDVRYFNNPTSYLSGVDILVEILRDGEVIDGYTEESTTDNSGHRTIGIRLLNDAEPGIYQIRVNGTYDDFWDVDTTNIEVVETLQNLEIHLETDRRGNDYYPGDRVTIYYTVTLQGQIVTNANVQYLIGNDQEIINYEYGEGGIIEFTIPSDYNPDYSGDFFVDVFARIDQDTSGWNQIDIPVRLGWILLNVDQEEYVSGDNVTFEYDLLHIHQGTIASVEYRITDAAGEIVEMGTPYDGQFTYTIPQYPSRNYEGHIIILTTGGNEITARRRVIERSGFYLKLEIVTESDYTTGVFVSGQNMRIRYELISRSDRALPEVITVNYQINSEYFWKSIRTNETTGMIEITLPELVDGEHILYVGATGYAENIRIFEIENDPSWTNKNSPINGVGQFAFMMLILLIIALVIGSIATVLVLFRKPKTEEPGTYEEDMEEPAPYEEEPTEEEDIFVETGEPEPEDQWSEEPDIPEVEPQEEQEW